MQPIQDHLNLIEASQKRLAGLLAISTAVNQSLDVDEVTNVASDRIIELIPADGIMLFVLDEESSMLELRAHRGISSDLALAMRQVQLGSGPHGIVASLGEPVLISDPSFDPNIPPALLRTEKLGAEYIYPLKSREQVVGTLCLIAGLEKELSQPDRELLGFIGLEIGVAIEKARLFRKSEQAMKRYRELFEKAHDGIWVQDTEGTIVTVNQAAASMAGYDVNDLIGQYVIKFLSPDALGLAKEVRYKLLHGLPINQPYEQKILCKDGRVAFVMLTTSLLGDVEHPIGFQHIARDITNEKELQEELRTYISQISSAHEEERNRIARELHDDTIQALIALSHRVDRLSAKWEPPPAGAAEVIEKMRGDLDGILVRLRRFIQELRPPTLEYLGFLPALTELIRELKQESGINAALDVHGTPRTLTKQEELLVYRIIQEALSNVRKHSHATKVDVKIEYLDDKTRIRIIDNGFGFSQKGTMELAGSGKLGLAGMFERARYIKGILNIESVPNAGTTIMLDIPASP